MKKNKCSSKEYQKKSKSTYYFKSAVLFAGVSILTTKVLPKISSKLYKESVKRSNRAVNDSEIEPIIEKKKELRRL